MKIISSKIAFSYTKYLIIYGILKCVRLLVRHVFPETGNLSVVPISLSIKNILLKNYKIALYFENTLKQIRILRFFFLNVDVGRHKY